jgi:hypothetical protein
MRLPVVVFSEAGCVVESLVVELECLPESFYLSLRCRFSSGTESMLDPTLRAEVGEPSRCVVAVLRRMRGSQQVSFLIHRLTALS